MDTKAGWEVSGVGDVSSVCSAFGVSCLVEGLWEQRLLHSELRKEVHRYGRPPPYRDHGNNSQKMSGEGGLPKYRLGKT